MIKQYQAGTLVFWVPVVTHDPFSPIPIHQVGIDLPILLRENYGQHLTMRDIDLIPNGDNYDIVAWFHVAPNPKEAMFIGTFTPRRAAPDKNFLNQFRASTSRVGSLLLFIGSRMAEGVLSRNSRFTPHAFLSHVESPSKDSRFTIVLISFVEESFSA